VTRKEEIVFERNKTRFETIEENPDFWSVCVVYKKNKNIYIYTFSIIFKSAQ